MREPKFIEAWWANRIGLGVSWGVYHKGIEIGIMLPFLTVSFYIKKKEATNDQKEEG